MINRLRLRLTFWFCVLLMIAYFIDGAASFWILSSRINAAAQNNLMRMCQEIAPAVDYKNGKPTLSDWMNIAIKRHIPAQTTIQLYGADENLVESYGPKGINQLERGKIRAVDKEKQMSVYSYFINLPEGCFVQVQLPSLSIDQTSNDFIINKILRSIPLAILLAIFGWFFSGRAVEPIKKSLKTLRNFVDDAGHELNTPVALIENSIETLEADLIDHKMSTDVLQIIQRASSSLKDLSQKLLLLAKMEQPEISMHFVPVNLSDLVADVVHDFTPKACNQNIELSTHDLAEAIVWADSQALVEVFSNLIENALRYTPPNGRIYVYSFKADKNICVAVRDTGCGIPKDCQRNIFNRFYRVDKARTKSAGGSGLGLSIVKAIVEAHKGNIRVESIPDKGSTFFVTLPILLGKDLKSARTAIKPQ